MAGTDSTGSFNSTDFRNAIHQAMTMGMSPNTSEQATFIFDDVATYATEDPRDLPYDWTEGKKTDVPQKTVSVPYAVTWGLGGVTADEMGVIDTSVGQITLLDTDYALVKGCNEVIINGFHYVIVAWNPPVGLFDAAVYTANIQARG